MFATRNVVGIALHTTPGNQYGVKVPTEPRSRGQEFAELIRTARTRAGLTQGELAEQTGLDRSTIIRWESGSVTRPEPDQVRAVSRRLGLPPHSAAIALGFLAPEDVESVSADQALPPQIREVIAILEDPRISEADKNNWVDYLMFLREKVQKRSGNGPVAS